MQLFDSITIKINLKMNDDDYVQSFLTQECKQRHKNDKVCPTSHLLSKGRWREKQWQLYVEFSLKQITEKSKQFNNKFNSFTMGRRAYTGFDKRFVEFLKNQSGIQEITFSQQKRLIKRTKSKFNTLKRRFKQSKKKRSDNLGATSDYADFIYQEASRFKNIGVINFQKLIEGYEVVKLEQIQAQHAESTSITADNEAVKKQPTIITRSHKNKQKQNGSWRFD